MDAASAVTRVVPHAMKVVIFLRLKTVSLHVWRNVQEVKPTTSSLTNVRLVKKIAKSATLQHMSTKVLGLWNFATNALLDSISIKTMNVFRLAHKDTTQMTCLDGVSSVIATAEPAQASSNAHPVMALTLNSKSLMENATMILKENQRRSFLMILMKSLSPFQSLISMNQSHLLILMNTQQEETFQNDLSSIHSATILCLNSTGTRKQNLKILKLKCCLTP